MPPPTPARRGRCRHARWSAAAGTGRPSRSPHTTAMPPADRGPRGRACAHGPPARRPGPCRSPAPSRGGWCWRRARRNADRSRGRGATGSPAAIRPGRTRTPRSGPPGRVSTSPANADARNPARWRKRMPRAPATVPTGRFRWPLAKATSPAADGPRRRARGQPAVVDARRCPMPRPAMATIAPRAPGRPGPS